MRVLFLPVLLVFFVGCGSLGQSTDDSPKWIQVLDKIAGVSAKLDKTGPVPVVTVEKSAPLDPTGGSIPIAGTAISALGLAWYFIRRLAASHDNAVTALGMSSPPSTLDVKT